jgi:hypothetical protein
MFKMNWELIKEQLKIELKTEVIQTYSIRRQRVLDELADQTERVTWGQQLLEANTYLSGQQSAGAFISELVTSRGRSETVEELSSKIINKADSFAKLMAALLGEQKALLDAISAANSFLELENIKRKIYE